MTQECGRPEQIQRSTFENNPKIVFGFNMSRYPRVILVGIQSLNLKSRNVPLYQKSDQSVIHMAKTGWRNSRILLFVAIVSCSYLLAKGVLGSAN